MTARTNHGIRKTRVIEKDLLYLADAVKALALAELVLDLPGTLFGLLEGAQSIGLFPVSEVDVAQVEVCPVEILQQLTLPLERKNRQADDQFTHLPPLTGRY